MTTLSLTPGVPATRRTVSEALERSLRRMGVEQLDVVQLCWCVNPPVGLVVGGFEFCDNE